MIHILLSIRKYVCSHNMNVFLGNISGAAECLGRKQWSGATAIFANELPTIVFPGKKIEIIHVICSLRSSSTTQSSIDYVWLTKLGHQFQVGSIF